MVTLLHISDLHRSPSAPVPNSYLLSCLLLDISRHQIENPKIPKCDGIVITGDLVEGAPLDDSNPEKTTRAQYQEAGEFLTSLCEKLVDGDRRRLFITPGNHDVSWAVSYRAMRRLQHKPEDDIRRALDKKDTNVRWSWRDFHPYIISDPTLYDKRLGFFKEFFDAFYGGLGHSFELDPTKQTVNYRFPDSDILITSFCSLYGNDCFNRRGRISQEAIANNDLIPQSGEESATLKIAIFHHSPATSSYQEDCLDSFDTIPLLIDREYAVALHGHQHCSSATTFSDVLDAGQYMPLIGCGSLCAGPYEIPPGYRRQYNMIEIDEKSFTLKVHAREWFNNLVWARAKLPEWNGESWIELKLPILESIARKTAIKKENSQRMANISAAEKAVKSQDFRTAIALLRVEPLEIPLVRKLLLLSYHKEGAWDEIIKLADTPKNEDEIVMAFEAYMRLNQLDKIDAMLNQFSRNGDMNPHLIAELRKRLEFERKIEGNK